MITTNSPEYDMKCRLYRHHGMGVSDLERASSKKIIFEDYVTTGFNYRMTDIQAAVGIEQIKRLPYILEQRRRIAACYQETLKDIHWLMLPSEAVHCKTNWQSYPVRLLSDTPLSCVDLMQHLLDTGMSTRRGVINSHQELPYRSVNWFLPNSELCRDNTILLPIFPDMANEAVYYASKSLKQNKKIFSQSTL